MVSLPKQLQVQCTQQRGEIGRPCLPARFEGPAGGGWSVTTPPHKGQKRGDLHRSQLRVAA